MRGYSSDTATGGTSPYTPLPDVNNMRFTPVSRIASKRICVNRVPLSKSTSGSFAARAMSEFAAK